MDLGEAVRREMRVAFSRRAQPPWVRVLKWIVIVGISARLWRTAWFWWWIGGAFTTGFSIHFFWRWKTHGWTRPWIGWDDVQAARGPAGAAPLLFSYGTLQQADVQRTTFGRLLQGQRDELPGFEPSLVAIDDPQVVAATGRTHHANVTFNGRSDSRVSGTVFEITDAELAAADRYEQSASYTRVTAKLASGRQTWVYLHARAGVDPGDRHDQ